MANIALTTFNGGEMSPLLDARGDLEKYSSGCRTLENMLPLVQGAVTVRPGTEYIATVKTNPKTVRLIPFIYSSSVAYMCEFGEEYIRFFYNGAPLDDGATPTPSLIEVVTPYQEEDLKSIHYRQIGDVMWLVHPAYPPAKLIRTSATTFEYYEIPFTNGPFRKRNDLDKDDDVTLSCSVVNKGDSGTLTASSATFNVAGHVGSLWQLTETRKDLAVQEVVTGSNLRVGAPITIKGTFTFTTHGTWTGTVTLERNVNRAGWDTYRTYVSVDDNNVSFAGTEDDDDVEYRVNVTAHTSGTIKADIEVDSSIILGVVRVDSVESTTSATVTVLSPLAYATAKSITGISRAAKCVVTCPKHGFKDGDGITIADVGGMTEITDGDYTVGEVTTNAFKLRNADDTAYIDSSAYTAYTSGGVVNGFQGTLNTTTKRWAEGSWSDYRGYPSAVCFHEDRCVYGGNTGQPQTVWLSGVDDYENFAVGVNDDNPFELTMAATNRIRWLEGLEALCLGTGADEWRIMSNKLGQPITPTNFNVRKQTTYGSDRMQTVRANQAVLFLDPAGRKIREFTYRTDADQYVAPDLTALAEHITEGGIVSMALQTSPEMILWCYRGDGTLLSLTYQRDQNVTAWARHTTSDTHDVTGAGGGEEGGTVVAPSAPVAPGDEEPAEGEENDDAVPSSCPIGATPWADFLSDGVMVEGLYPYYRIKDYVDGVVDAAGMVGTGEGTLTASVSQPLWQGVFVSNAAGSPCVWDVDYTGGQEIDGATVSYGAAGDGARGGLELVDVGAGVMNWQITIPGDEDATSDWLPIWIGRKATGSNPVGTYTRLADPNGGGGTGPATLYLEAVP